MRWRRCARIREQKSIFREPGDRPARLKDMGANLPDDFDSPRLARDLTGLYRQPVSVPPAVDEAVLAVARRRLAGRRRVMRIVRWAPLSAAAAIVLAVLLTRSLFWARPHAQGTTVAEDVNGDGRVDILDAFALARHLRGAGAGGNFRDVTGDGAVDERDITRIAAVAVDLRRGVFQ